MKLKRPLKGSENGADVRMVQRALNKAPSRTVIKTTGVYDETTKKRVAAFQKARSLATTSGVFIQETLDALWPYFDAYGRMRYRLFIPPRVLAMCFPLPSNMSGEVCQGLHQTAGIPGNWAMDFCDNAGTPVLSPEAGRVAKLSGHDPRFAHPNPDGIFGWSIYVETPSGYVYFVTHLGVRAPLAIGIRVKAGDVLGEIGNQLPITGRPNHTHIGVTSPLGQTDAKKRITAVSRAQRVEVQL